MSWLPQTRRSVICSPCHRPLDGQVDPYPGKVFGSAHNFGSKRLTPGRHRMSLVSSECLVQWCPVSPYQMGPTFSTSLYTVMVVEITLVSLLGIYGALQWKPVKGPKPKTRTVATQSMCTYRRKLATPRFEWIVPRGEDGAWIDEDFPALPSWFKSY